MALLRSQVPLKLTFDFFVHVELQYDDCPRFAADAGAKQCIQGRGRVFNPFSWRFSILRSICTSCCDASQSVLSNPHITRYKCTPPRTIRAVLPGLPHVIYTRRFSLPSDFKRTYLTRKWSQCAYYGSFADHPNSNPTRNKSCLCSA